MAELAVTGIESDDKYQLKCDLCRLDGETVRGVIVCVDCMDCLCSTCSEIHLNNEVFKGHKTVTKDTLPLNFTSPTLHELKDMVFCDIHEVQFEYYCEEHAKFVCQPCTKKAHRGCKRITKIQNVQSSPVLVLSEIQEIRKWFQEITKQRKELKELESTETKRQIQLKRTILAKIQTCIDQDSSGNKKDDNKDNMEKVDLLCDDVRRVVGLQDRHEELLRAAIHLSDTERITAVSRRVAMSLQISSLKQSIESSLGRMGKVKQISDGLEIVQVVTDELLNALRCGNKGDFCNRIRHLIKETTYTNAEVQSQLYQDTNEEQLTKVCVTEPYKSSDVNTNLHPAEREADTFKDAEVQTEDASTTSSMIAQGTCTTEYLTASADVDTEPVDITGPCTSQQSDISSVVHGSRNTDREDERCQTPDNTKHRDNNVPLLHSRLEHIGVYNVCTEGEEKCCIKGIVVLKDMRKALLDSKNKKLKIYDEYFNFLISYGLKWHPIDICVVDYDLNRVAISFDSRRVETYQVYKGTISYIRGFDLSLNCRGLSSVSRYQIAVLVSDVTSVDGSGCYPCTNSDEDDMEIQIRDINNGRIISCIDKFEKEVRNPVFIIVDNQSNVIIGEENQVSAFDKNGDRLWSYKGYNDSKMDNVLGMDMDPEGNIYVCSHGSNSIHQVSSFNYRNNRVIIPHVPIPMSVAYDHHQKRLFVGSGNSSVYVYMFV